MAMDKKKQQLIMMGGLVVVLLFVLANTFASISKRKRRMSGRKSKKAVAAKKDAAKKDSASVAKTAIDSSLPKVGGFKLDKKIAESQLSRVTEEDWVFRDPFYPAGKKATAKRGSLVLKGISYSESGGSFALINEEIIKFHFSDISKK